MFVKTWLNKKKEIQNRVFVDEKTMSENSAQGIVFVDKCVCSINFSLGLWKGGKTLFFAETTQLSLSCEGSEEWVKTQMYYISNMLNIPLYVLRYLRSLDWKENVINSREDFVQL